MSDPELIDECIAAKREAARVAWEKSTVAFNLGDIVDAQRLARNAESLRREADRMEARDGLRGRA